MAKIFLISRERNSTVESLIESLETEQQPIYLHLTSEPSVKNFFLICASFLRLRADLLYFVFENENLNWMEKALIETLGSMPHQNTAATFIDLIDHKKSPILRRFLKKVDLLTLPTRQSLADLRGLNSISRRQFRALLPPIPTLNTEEHEITAAESELLKYVRDHKIWILPFDEEYFEKHQSFLSTVAKEKTWLFLANRSDWKFQTHEKYQKLTEHWKNKPLWSGNISDSCLIKVFENSEAILLAGHQCKPSEYVKWASLAALSGVYAILDTHQIELFSGLWAVGENCALVDKDFSQQELENRWVAGSLIPPNFRKKPRSPSMALDESLNELNRWITKTLTDRRMA